MLNRLMFHVTIVAALLMPGLPAFAQGEPPVKLRPVPFTQVQVKGGFWGPRVETNRTASIPHGLDELEKAGNIHNFELAAEHARAGYKGFVFNDSDVYKVLEAASYALATHPDPALEQRVDEVIAKIASAQAPDGYLDTYYEINAPDKRWTNLRDNHELYCAGHLFEAAVAHYQATGKHTLLHVATRLADLLASRFGSAPGQRMGYPGHPEIELALVKLSRATGQKRYFDLARFFVENRGSRFFAEEHGTPLDKYDGAYWLDDVPIRDHTHIEGHAVRACYLMSGVADVAEETDDAELLKMVDRVWSNTTQRNMYVTGGIGSSSSNEGFTTDYDLPNLTAYQETCASVAMMLWNQRLNLLYADAKYADLVELALYNGFLAGVSLDGTKFFYVNPLESTGSHHRQPWFACACCPPNVMRTLASLGGCAYATADRGLWVSHYIQGSVHTEVAGSKLELDVATNYPWDGEVKLTVRPQRAARFALSLRIPGWCSGASVRVNGDAVKDAPMEHGYLVLDREWKPGDVVALDLPMLPRRIEANPHVKEDRGQLAIARGPLIYCLEGCDNAEPLSSVALPADASLILAKAPPALGGGGQEPGVLGGIVALKGTGLAVSDTEWAGGLYRTAPARRRVTLTAIPYYAWDNRAPGAMRVWIPTAPPPPLPAAGPERKARVTLSFVSSNCQPEGIHDGIEPTCSGQQPAALCHWWPHKGGEEWAQYTWDHPITVSGSQVYWFDDTGRGECRLPAGWQIQYLDGREWKPVQPSTGADYPVHLDHWCEVRCTPVSTTALRLVIRMQPNWAAGVHEWKVLTPDGN